jgi:hypothetical protein
VKIGEKLNVEEGAAADLLCARCKRPVKAGEAHHCEKENHNENNRKKIPWSSGTPFRL